MRGRTRNKWRRNSGRQGGDGEDTGRTPNLNGEIAPEDGDGTGVVCTPSCSRPCVNFEHHIANTERFGRCTRSSSTP
eukprot:2740870-Rhodomonas_salina.5